MKYVSTRGKAPKLGFADAMLTGLAEDGGLYWPESLPHFSYKDWQALAGLDYVSQATALLTPFLGEDWGTTDELAQLLLDSYSAFSHPAIAPLRQWQGNLWQLDLTQGPTLSFKDYALQFLGRVMERELVKRSSFATIIGATSGDTGSAAIEAVRGKKNIRIIMLHPKGRVSDIQRLQMTHINDENVHNIAIEGTFDDCQDLVKAMFANPDLRQKARLAAVNSINWARILAQMVYYASSALALGAGDGRQVSYAVPTGNFGNILAAWCVKQMGLPLGQLVIGSNQNDILTRFIHNNDMTRNQVVPTHAPAMDIQISSNFERYLFERLGKDGEKTASLLAAFREKGALGNDKVFWQKATSEFQAAAYSDSDIEALLKEHYALSGEIADPHSAIGLAAAFHHWQDRSQPMVAVATAHAAKFGDIAKKATGMAPALPARLQKLVGAKEYYQELPADKDALHDYILGCL